MKKVFTLIFLLNAIILSAQNGTIEAVEGIIVGNNTGTTNGTIRYTGTDVEARIAGNWESLTNGAGSPIWNLDGLNAYYTNGYVGVGTLSPTSDLHVVSDGSSVETVDFTTGDLSVNNDLLNLTVGSASDDNAQVIEAKRGNIDVFVVNADGQTSIGKGNPLEQLDVNGAIKIGNTTSANSGSIRYTGSDFEGYTGGSWQSLLTSSSPWNSTGSDINFMAGNVGIGVGSPLDALHVNGDLRFEGSQYLEWYEGSVQKAFLNYSGTNLFLNNGETSGSIEIDTEDDFIVQTGAGSGLTRLFIDQDGVSRFGANLNNKVSINPLDDSDTSSGTTTSASFQMTDSNGTNTVTLYSNNVGNTGALMLLAEENGENTITLDADNNTGGQITLADEEGDEFIVLQAKETSTTGAAIKMYNEAGDLTIELDSDFSNNGRIITDEVQINGGSDFAEHFDIIESKFSPLPGMVVSIDPGSSGKLVISSEVNDKRVAGIISGANGVRPGLMMGQVGSIADGEYPIALTGRAYVYTSKEGGEVMPGDLLTTSNTPGYAMKVSDINAAQGAIIGKAMTRVDENGFVLVLVNLQ